MSSSQVGFPSVPRVSSGERTAGTQILERRFSPLDIAEMAAAHGGGSSGVETQEEGIQAVAASTILNFIGAGVTAADGGGGVTTVTIPGGASVTAVRDEGTIVLSAPDDINFAGAGVTVTDDGDGTVTVTIPGGGGASLETQEEGVQVLAASSVLNFVGVGVTATDGGGGVTTVTIPGGSGIVTQEEGVQVLASSTTLNFVGAGVTATDGGSGVTTVTIPGGGGSSITVQDEGTPLTTGVTLFNFAGAGVTVTEPVADQVLVTIPGGAGGGGGSTPFYDDTLAVASTLGSYDQNISIPSGVLDFEVLITIPPKGGGINPAFRFNNDATADYDSRRWFAYATSTVGTNELDASTNATLLRSSGDADAGEQFHRIRVYQPEANGPVYFWTENAANSATLSIAAGVWQNTGNAALTSIDIAAGFGQGFPIGTKIVAKETGGGGGSALTVENEGTPLSTAVTKINFAGAGVTVTEPVADEILVTIPGVGWEVKETVTTTGGSKLTIDCSGEDEIMLIVRQLSTSVSGFGELRLSTDGGTTTLNGATDYKNISISGGTEASGDAGGFPLADASITGDHIAHVIIRGANNASINTSMDVFAGSGASNAVTRRGWAATAAVHDAIIIDASGGTFDAVDILVCRRVGVGGGGGYTGEFSPRTTAVTGNLAATDFDGSQNGIICTNASPTDIVLTIPSGLGPTHSCTIFRKGTGEVDILAGGGVTILSEGGLLSIDAQYNAITLFPTGVSEEYALVGKIKA